MSKDYYQILGLSKSATREEIKRAYRKLAHQHHPDKAGLNGEAKFKEINEAYQVLSDPQKRANYDRFGTADVGGGFNWGQTGDNARDYREWGAQDPFGGGSDNQGGFGFNFGGGLGDIFENIFGQAFSQVQTELSITLTQAVLGVEIDLAITSGEKITLKIPAGTQDGTTFRFRGKGQSFRRGRGEGRGDLLVTVRVQIPKRLSREQKELLEKLRNLGL